MDPSVLDGVAFKWAIDDKGKKTPRVENSKENQALAREYFGMSADPMAALAAAAVARRDDRREEEREAVRKREAAEKAASDA